MPVWKSHQDLCLFSVCLSLISIIMSHCLISALMSFLPSLPFHFPPSLSLSLSRSLVLSFLLQGRRVATCSSTTSLRSLGMASWCRCSCLSVMSSPPKCLWIGRQTKVNALVGNNDKTPVKITIILSLLMFLPHFSTTAKLFQNTRGSRG